MPNNSRSGGLDLASLFNVATQALAANQSTLNQADTENQNHGDNMVQAFNMITQALGSQPGASPSQQLDHASLIFVPARYKRIGTSLLTGISPSRTAIPGTSISDTR
ncbi:MAG: hypothetical protein QM730_16955 [Anaerolineales bacterium]